MKNKVIVFDMDGVLFDTIPYARKVFLETHPGVTENMYNELHSGNFHIEHKKYSHLRISQTEEEKNIHHQKYSEIKSKTPMFQGIKELLEKLHKMGYILIVNTNAYEKNCLPIFENSKITHLFDFIATAELSKNKTEKFKIIQDKYNINSKDVIFITDALGDVKESYIVNISTIVVTWGVHNNSFFDLKKYSNIIGIVDTVKELGDFIEKF